MITIPFRYIAASLAFAGTLSASAQSLSGEITVERTITPAERPASRLGSVSPAINTPQIKLKTLSPAQYNGVGQLSRSLTRLEPAAYADTFAVDPWRGYVSAGYFPGLNLAVDAGFDLIATKTTRLGTFLNVDAQSYKAASALDLSGHRYSVSNSAFTVGADLSTEVASHRTVDARAAYTFSTLKMPGAGYDIEGGANHATLSLGYSDSHSALPWNAALEYYYFGFRHDTPWSLPDALSLTKLPAASESLLGIDGDLTWRQDNHWWKLGLGADIQWLDRLASLWPLGYEDSLDPTNVVAVPTYWDEGAKTLSVITLNPSYNLSRTNVAVRLGAILQYTTGPRGNKFKVAPDVNFTWTPSGRVALGVTLSGGEQLNSLATLNQISPWLIPAFSYERSNVPFALDATLNFGPFAGFSIRPFAGFALADSWLMPAVIEGPVINKYQSQNVHGGHYGLELSYAYRSLLRVTASVEGASSSDSDHESAYYLWRDRAKFQARINIETRPIKPLTVGLDFTCRTDRKAYVLTPQGYKATDGGLYLSWFDYDRTLDLGDICNLSLNATWRFTPAFSVFANIDNMLCRRYDIIYGVPSARLSGLVGLTFKF